MTKFNSAKVCENQNIEETKEEIKMVKTSSIRSSHDEIKIDMDALSGKLSAISIQQSVMNTCKNEDGTCSIEGILTKKISNLKMNDIYSENSSNESKSSKEKEISDSGSIESDSDNNEDEDDVGEEKRSYLTRGKTEKNHLHSRPDPIRPNNGSGYNSHRNFYNQYETRNREKPYNNFQTVNYDLYSTKVQNESNIAAVQSEDLVTTINSIIGNESPLPLEDNSLFKTSVDQVRSVLEDVDELSRYEIRGSSVCGNYERCPSYGPLTPPKSVSPAFQDEFTCLPKETDTEDQISSLLYGLDQINPSEFNIYLPEAETKNFDCDVQNYARTIREKCKDSYMAKTEKKLGSLPRHKLIGRDEDGDTNLHIICCNAESKPKFYEILYCLHRKLKTLFCCCDKPVDDWQTCVICGNRNKDLFYTPLSFKNNQGYSPLACALVHNLTEDVILFMLNELRSCKMDIQKVFNGRSGMVIEEFVAKYPALKQYI